MASDTTSNPERPAGETPNRETPAAKPSEAEATAALNSVEGAIREFVRRDVIASPRKPPEPLSRPAAAEPPEPATGGVEMFIQRTGGASIKEIDRLIAELKVVRDFLQAEGERVQREVANYTQVSHAALSSAKIILDSMGQWKSAAGAPPPRTPR